MTEALDDGVGEPPVESAFLRLTLDQFREEARLYNRAVGSYNTHLDNHRERRALHDVPFREPITAHDGFEGVLAGDVTAIDSLLQSLLDESHLDSQLRRHPRTYPIHEEAVDQLEIARQAVISTLEELLLELHLSDGLDPSDTTRL